MVATGLSPSQVARFRLRRHHLASRAPAPALLDVVGEIGGAQAQLLRAAQLALSARVDGIHREDVDRAVGVDRSLVRAWCMRRTLFLLPAVRLAEFVRGSARRALREVEWVAHRGVPGPAIDRLIDAALGTMEEPRTATEIAEGTARALDVPVRWDRGGGWGSGRRVACVPLKDLRLPAPYLLHLIGARGVTCSGPPRNGRATFVRADRWVPGFRDLPPEEAEDRLLRTYLRAYAPATPADYARWTGMRLRDVRAVWARAGDAIVPVTVDGGASFALREDVEELASPTAAASSVRLLPHFDSYLLGHRERTHLVAATHHRTVYRDQGWISPVVLVDGAVAGTWSGTVQGGALHVEVRPIRRISSRLRAGVRDEAERLANFDRLPLGRLVFASP